MRHFLRSIVTSLLLLVGTGLIAQAQQGVKPTEEGGKMLKKEGKVSAKMLREDERAERTRTVRADGSMTKKPRFIREEDRFNHRKHPQRAPTTPTTIRTKRHTTLKG